MTTDQTTDETTLAVVREVEAYRQGTGDPARLLAAFRATRVHVCRQLDPPAVSTLAVPGMGRWLPVFTTTAAMTSTFGAEHEVMILTGAEVLDLLLPVLPEGLGVVLDPHTPWMMTFPPVAPIVSHAQALPVPAGQT